MWGGLFPIACICNHVYGIDNGSTIKRLYEGYIPSNITLIPGDWFEINPVPIIQGRTINKVIIYGVLSALRNMDEVYRFIDKALSLLPENGEILLGDIPNKDKKICIDKPIERIELINVSYKYQGQKEYALKNINLTLMKNEIAVLVGENGSGKTTLIKLLNGLYDDYEGVILINNIDLKEIDKESIRTKISTLFQDYNKYQFSVEENIGFGDIAEINNHDKIKTAAIQATADDFILKLNNKYNQQLGTWFKNGTQLSGGQWQKLAIARLYMKGGDVYILDEPTASLDPKSEYYFFNQLKKNTNNKISLFITHRFVNANISNNIIVMSHGEIVESGSHDQLMNLNGIYKKMYDFQYS